MKKISGLEYVISENGFDFYLYRPTLLKPYWNEYPSDEQPQYEKRIIHRLRMILELLFGHCRVYYVMRNGTVFGYAVVTHGSRRIKICTRRDVVIGPVWTCPSYRGIGVATACIHAILYELGTEYEYAYEFIDRENISSIRTVEKNGFELLGSCREKGILKKLELSENGNILLYRFSWKGI